MSEQGIYGDDRSEAMGHDDHGTWLEIAQDRLSEVSVDSLPVVRVS
jgi:hypothetical protein